MNSYGLVFGGEKTSHDSGNDITYQVVTGNNYSQVVIEGDEYILPKEAMQSEKVYDFVDKLPIEMLDEIKRSENVFIQFPNLRQGDMVVCKNSVRNDDLHTIKGTAKEIANYLQGLSACRMYAKGGYISGELANGGGVEDESQLRLLTPMPPTKLGKTGIDSLTEIVGKDDLREAMSGAFYAGNGRIVATDAHILVVLENQNYPKSLEGTIKSLWNKVPQERLVGIPYPNWEAVVPNQQNFQTKELSIDDVLAYAYGGFLEGKKIIKEKDFDKYEKRIFKYILRLNIGNIEVGVDSLMLTRILRVLRANDVRKIVLHITGKQKAIKITTDKKHYGLIMPVMIADKVEDNEENIYVSQQIFYPISDKDFRAMSKKYGEYLTEFSKMVGGERMAEGGEITMNVPLLLRVLELAKEDVKEDKELHFIAERLQSLSKKGTLTMEDYDYISGLESNDKIQKLIAENDSKDSDLRFEQGGGVEDEINPEQIRAEIEALEEILEVLEGEDRQSIQEEIEILKLSLGELEHTKLLAPNGKPSNLTPEQWHLVRTPQFKAWFGDWENSPNTASKVVDENGEPLVVFREIEATEKNYFNTEVPNFAKSVRWQTNLDRILRRKLPSETKVGDEVIGFNKRGVVTEINNGLFKIKYEDGSVFSGNAFGLTFYGEKKPKKVLSAFLNIRILGDYEKLFVHSFGVQKDSGILSISPDYKTYFTFRSNQVKLADGSNTTFDANNPDIRYEQGGGIKKKSELLAPNGKPSNLTPEQWHLVRTPEFKAWFGDWEALENAKLRDKGMDEVTLKNLASNVSKVVDKNGEPMVVYHNSRAETKFYEFKPILTYFTSSKNYNPTLGGIKYETFLNIRKPYKPKDKVHRGLLEPQFDNLKQKFDGLIGVDAGQLDYDVFVVWHSKQIKLADGSNTTFDANNPDIRFEQGGGVLLAPNGKPSNLTPEQWHLVRTPQFKAWFGDWENDTENASKVVDKNGEPLVLYRGNEGQMGKYGFEFKLGLNLLRKPNKNDFGFFFTDDLEVAKKYRKVDFDDSYIAGSITPIFLKAVKVLDLSDFGDKVWQEEFVIGLEEKGIKFDSFEHLPNKIINYFDEGGSYKGWGNNTFDYFDVFPELRDLFLANGYKAVLFKEISRHYSPYNVFVAFHSNQIKLADGSNTTFDSNNPDIRFEQGGGFSYL